jgi:hypothetical protein
MMQSFCTKICGVRFLWGSVITKPFGLSVDRNICAPFVLKPNNTHKTGFISFVGAAHVFRIASFVNYAKVKKSVVRFNAVNVVNQPRRPTAVHVQPSQPMRFVNFFAQAYCYVPGLVRVARSITNLNAFGGALFPSKMASSGVIRQKITKFICGHIGSPLLKANVNTGTIK